MCFEYSQIKKQNYVGAKIIGGKKHNETADDGTPELRCLSVYYHANNNEWEKNRNNTKTRQVLR